MKRKKYSIEDLPDESIIDDGKQKFGLPDVVIPAEVLFNPNLTLVQKILFGFIRNLASTEKGCWASNRYLARCLDVEKQTVTNGVAKLKDCFYITVQFRRLSNGNQGRVIFIDKRYPQLYAEYIQKIYKNINNPILPRLYHPINTIMLPYNHFYGKNNNKNNINNYMFVEEDLEFKKNGSNGFITVSDFHKFWAIWPAHRRGSKGEALTKWETACNNKQHRPTWNRVERAITKQKASEQWQTDDGKYIPLARTWIHQKRWLDDPSQLKGYNSNGQNGTPENQYGEAWKDQFGFKDEE